MHRSIHARRLAREALERAPSGAAARAAGGAPAAGNVSGSARVRAALAVLADRHLARREAVALDATHGDPAALLASLEADVPTLAVPPSGGVEALATALEGRRIDALHLFCGGSNAALDLGGQRLAPLRPSARDRAALGRLALALAGAEGRPVVHLYGSPFGTGGEGRAAARALSRALGAAIAATRDDGTGGEAEPDWHIELPAPEGGAQLPRERAPGRSGGRRRAHGPPTAGERSVAPARSAPAPQSAPGADQRPGAGRTRMPDASGPPSVEAPTVAPSDPPARHGASERAGARDGAPVSAPPAAGPPASTSSVPGRTASIGFFGADLPPPVFAPARDPFSVFGGRVGLGTASPSARLVDPQWRSDEGAPIPSRAPTPSGGASPDPTGSPDERVRSTGPAAPDRAVPDRTRPVPSRDGTAASREDRLAAPVPSSNVPSAPAATAPPSEAAGQRRGGRHARSRSPREAPPAPARIAERDTAVTTRQDEGFVAPRPSPNEGPVARRASGAPTGKPPRTPPSSVSAPPAAPPAAPPPAAAPASADRRAALRVRAVSVEAWFRAAVGVGERLLLGPRDAPHLLIDGPRLVLVVPTPAGERRAVADLSRLGIEDASARLVHAVGTVREDWACLYVEGALAATARLDGRRDGEDREWPVAHRGPRGAAFEGELGLARLYARALAGREVLANHRATRGEGKPTGGALWSTGPLTGRAGAGASVSEPEASATRPGEAAMPEPVSRGSSPVERDDAAGDGEVPAAGTVVAPESAPASATEPPAPARSGETADGGDGTRAERVRLRGAPVARPDPFGPRIARVASPADVLARPDLPARPGREVHGARPMRGARRHPPVPAGNAMPSAPLVPAYGTIAPMPDRSGTRPSRVRRVGSGPSPRTETMETPPSLATEPARTPVPSSGPAPEKGGALREASGDEATAAPDGAREGAARDMARDIVVVRPDVGGASPDAEPVGGRSEVSRPTAGPSPTPPLTPPLMPIAGTLARTAPPPGDLAGDRAASGTDRDVPSARTAAPAPSVRPAAVPPAAAAPPAPSVPSGPTVQRVAPGDELRLDVTELAGCALIDAIAHWPVALPDWLALDGATGVARGTVPSRAAGERVRVAISAANGHGASATMAIELQVAGVAPSTAPGAPDPFTTIETAMRTAADAVPALRALLRAGSGPTGSGAGEAPGERVEGAG